MLLPALKPDVALIHAPMADRFGNVWIGRQRELATMAHAAARTIATVEKIHDGNLLDDPVLAAGTLPGFYVESIALAERGAWPLRLPDHYAADAEHLAEYARLAATAEGVRRNILRRVSWPGGVLSQERLFKDAAAGPEFRARDHVNFRSEELLADVIARLIGDVRHVAVGNASPIPATAALLARERGHGRPYVSLLQSRKHNFFTDGARELFDCAGQGRIDVFFLSGGQIDGQGNVNLVSTGDYEHPKVRFPGSFGSAYLYYVVPKVILFRTEHSRRTLVPKRRFHQRAGRERAECFSPGRADRAGHQPLPVLVRRRTLHARQRPSRPHGRGSDRAHRLRFRSTRHGARNAGALAGDAQALARDGGAAACRGLSAVRGPGFRGQ